MKPFLKYFIFFLAIMLLLMSCKLARKRRDRPPEAHAEKHVAENIRLAFTYRDIDTTLIYSFYKQREFMPAWVDEQDAAEELIEMLESSAYYGLDSADYKTGEIKHILSSIENEKNKDRKNELFANADIQLTSAYFLFALHVSEGRLDRETLVKRDSLKYDPVLVSHLEKAIDKENIRESIEALEPQQQDYLHLRKALANYLEQTGLSTDTVVIPDPALDSAACYAKVKEVLITQNYLDLTEADNDTLAIQALKHFQRQHGLKEDGKAGINTRTALSVSTYERYRQVVVNLEKWRWENDWGNRYVFVNIPAYHLKAYENGEPCMTLKVIVGKPSSPTPELSSHFEHIITNPFWHVPQGIYREELLPEIKTNPREYLTKHGYRILDNKNNIIDPDSVNWDDAGHYRIRQDAGSINALGHIKFNFRNRYNVYIHDTPSRRLFEKETRSMSHGCVRVQHPVKLAEFLLNAGMNDHTARDVEKLIVRGVQRKILLEEKVPVHIRYFTCEADKDLNIYFYRDVYGRDKVLKEKLFNDQQQQVALF